MIRRLIFDRRASAGVEMVLLLPILLVLMFGSLELGHYFYLEHKLVKAVRDGARYASRQSVDDMCNGATAKTDRVADIQRITATGQLASSTAPALVYGWTTSNVIVTIGCQQFVNTGIYTDLAANGPLVTVDSGNVNYPSIFGALGIIDTTFSIRAKSSAAVSGI